MGHRHILQLERIFPLARAGQVVSVFHVFFWLSRQARVGSRAWRTASGGISVDVYGAWPAARVFFFSFRRFCFPYTYEPVFRLRCGETRDAARHLGTSSRHHP